MTSLVPSSEGYITMTLFISSCRVYYRLSFIFLSLQNIITLEKPVGVVPRSPALNHCWGYGRACMNNGYVTDHSYDK